MAAAEVEAAKAYLQKLPTIHNNESVYDHVSNVLQKVLTERPNNAADMFETYLSCPPSSKNEAVGDSYIDLKRQTSDAEKNFKLFTKSTDGDDSPAPAPADYPEDEYEMPLPNCMELCYFFEQAGIGLTREDMYRTFLAFKSLVYNQQNQQNNLQNLRFWGKILGTSSNYLIAEVQFSEGSGDEDEEEDGHPEGEGDIAEGEDSQQETDQVPAENNELPKPTWKPAPPLPKEAHRTGTNKTVYFACNEAGDKWTKLPHVTPEEIVVARQIHKLFTGSLDAEVVSYPPFPGNEAALLRAQIARITAATQISPAGFYMFDEEDDIDLDGEGADFRENYLPNVEFDGLSLRELADPNMSGWVHHTQYILPQGRCRWYHSDPSAEDGDFDEDDIDEEEEPRDSYVKPETGPALLTSVSEDQTLTNSIPAWSSYLSSRVLPEYGVAVARSNRWPGAYSFAKLKRFENVYIGWGQKYSATCYNPGCAAEAYSEYLEGPEVQEVLDPTAEEEQAYKKRQQEKNKHDEHDALEEEEEDQD